MELLNQTKSAYFTYATQEARRSHQGVLLAYVKERNYDLFGDSDLEELFDEDSDVDDALLESDDDEMTLDHETKSKTLVAYMIYSRERDATTTDTDTGTTKSKDTVCIRELCVSSAYRKRRVAECFLRNVCETHFRAFAFKKCSFQVSSFHVDAMAALTRKKSPGMAKRAYCWKEFKFVPGVCDERTMFHFDIDEFLKKF